MLIYIAINLCFFRDEHARLLEKNKSQMEEINKLKYEIVTIAKLSLTVLIILISKLYQ